MALRDLIRRGRHDIDRRRDENDNPFFALQDRMNRIFDDVTRDFGLEPFGGERGFSPRIDVTEDDKTMRISAELPGMDDKDIDVSVEHGTLMLRGEKKHEHEEKNGGIYRMERSYGSFQRMIPLPEYVDHEKAEAEYKKGVLTVTLPKTAEAARQQRRIEVKGE